MSDYIQNAAVDEFDAPTACEWLEEFGKATADAARYRLMFALNHGHGASGRRETLELIAVSDQRAEQARQHVLAALREPEAR